MSLASPIPVSAPAPEEARAGRAPELVMRPERLGAFHQTRLSFSRALVRRIHRENWKVERLSFSIRADNVGEAQYTVMTPHGVLSFLALCHAIRDDQRTDRAIARFWDYTFSLSAGELDPGNLARLRVNLPLQDDGRFLPMDLVFSRANKSGRIFDDVVRSLASSRQPDERALEAIGYLIRTTAVFANGKMGLADYADLGPSTGLGNSFEAQMLMVWLIRQFSIDLVGELAKAIAPSKAITLAPEVARRVGVGNATGLGMAPFLVDHPQLLNAWMSARETALARVCALPRADRQTWDRFIALVRRARDHVEHWHTDDTRQSSRLKVLGRELDQVLGSVSGPKPLHAPTGPRCWHALLRHAEESFSAETCEMLVSLLLEPHSHLIDDLEYRSSTRESERILPEVSLEELLGQIEQAYGWALAYDFGRAENRHYFWYRSEVKGEPRLGLAGVDDGEEAAMVVAIAREIAELHADLAAMTEFDRRATPVGHYLLAAPHRRGAVARVQTLGYLPYAEVRANLVGADCMPIDLLRCKLAFFGATRFDPKSDRWVRVVLFQGAPLVEDFIEANADIDDWLFPSGPR